MATLRDGKNVFFRNSGARLTRIEGAPLPKVQPEFLYSSEKAYPIWADGMRVEVKRLRKLFETAANRSLRAMRGGAASDTKTQVLGIAKRANVISLSPLVAFVIA